VSQGLVNSSLSLFFDLFDISIVAMEMGDALDSKKCVKLGNTIMYKYTKRRCSYLETRTGRTTHETMLHGNVKLLINITMLHT
jgi:hypothetical protein